MEHAGIAHGKTVVVVVDEVIVTYIRRHSRKLNSGISVAATLTPSRSHLFDLVV